MIRIYIASVVLLITSFIGAVGCEQKNNPKSTAQNKVLLKIHAPNVVYLPGKLPIILNLKNISGEAIELMESTPCSVFRWRIVDEKNKTVQSKPNQLCTQVVAFSTLNPNQNTRQAYQISLNPNNYQTNSHYRLVYKFWRHSGHHDFTTLK